MPQGPAPSPTNDLIIKVQEDCHADVRRHYLPQLDRRAWHRHRQSNCRVVLVEPEDDDDDDGPRDCHREVRRHYLPEYGERLAHRHVGNSCRIRIYRRDDDGDGRNCVRFGALTFCEG